MSLVSGYYGMTILTLRSDFSQLLISCAVLVSETIHFALRHDQRMCVGFRSLVIHYICKVVVHWVLLC